MQSETDTSAQRAPLTLIIELTRKMLAAARQSDWDTVLSYENRRRLIMQQTFTNVPALSELSNLASCIEEILGLDRELIALAEGARTGFADQLSVLRTSKKAVKAYTLPATAS
ncbi:MAG: hypothetical protein FD165_137 [Gammaproteobacteria bacterium]|nr:MAG: hypothetical protein FD165_137 [Gammaproteobacteria bacterium]TND06715.1 MAG: hypothetical protein FD120_447 [Gammaproteobacteria bacterium]